MDKNFHEIDKTLRAMGFDQVPSRNQLEFFNYDHYLTMTANSLLIQSRHHDDDRGYFWHNDVSMKLGTTLTAAMLLQFMDIFGAIPYHRRNVMEAYNLTNTLQEASKQSPTLMRHAV